jgi:hypothetical protein
LSTQRLLARIVVFSLLAIGLLWLLWLYLVASSKDKYEWQERYRSDKTEPYDLSDFRKLSFGYFGERQILDDPTVFKRAVRNTGKQFTYVFVGRYLYLNRSEADSLLLAVKKGHHALIICDFIPDYLSNDVLSEWNAESIYREKLTLRLFHPSVSNKKYQVNYFYRDTVQSREWRFWSPGSVGSKYEENTYTSNLTKLGGLHADSLQFVRVKHGLGYFYLHLNPYLFTNLNMSRSDGFAYASAVLRHLNPQSVLLWDESGKQPKPDYETFSNRSETPLTFILQNRALRTAWYILLTSVLVLMVFRSRRMQRVIPVLPVLRNASMEFTRAIGRAFHKSNDYLSLNEKQWQMFLNYVRYHFKLSTNDIGEDFIRKLAEKSGQPYTEIEEIVKFGRLINEYGKDNKREAHRFNQMLTQFYKKHRN